MRKTWRLPLSVRALSPEDVADAHLCLLRGDYTQGDQVYAFERELSEWTGLKNIVVVNSGSSALLLAAHVLFPRVDPNGEVIIPAVCWSTTAWAFASRGLTPVLADVRQDLFLDVNSVRRCLSAKTRVIIAIHPLGLACDCSLLADLCESLSIPLVEDCCESIGAWRENKHVGMTGVASAFSFYHSHQLSTIEGGAIVTRDPAMADNLRSLRAHGWARDRSDAAELSAKYPKIDPRFLFIGEGYNMRLTEPQAAIGRSQLRRLDVSIAARRANAIRVTDILSKHRWARVISPILSCELRRREVKHSAMFLAFVAGLPRARVVAVLESHGVETRPIIAGNLGRHPAAQNRIVADRVDLSISDEIMSRGIMIGCPPDATEDGFAALAEACEELSR